MRLARWVFFFRLDTRHVADAKKLGACPEKLGRNRIRRGALDNDARPTQVQDATTALPSVRINAENIKNCKAANPYNLSWRKSFLFPAIGSTFIRMENQPKPTGACLNPSPSMKNKLIVAFTTKLTYKVLLTYWSIVKAMRAIIRLDDTKADVNLVHLSIVLFGAKHRNSVRIIQNCVPLRDNLSI